MAIAISLILGFYTTSLYWFYQLTLRPLLKSVPLPLEWPRGFFFGNTVLALELWNIIAGISGLDDY